MASPASRRRVLLVVEDNKLAQQALHDLLQQEGYVVCCADNGQEALDKLQLSPRPIGIILDLRMPIMDGWELLRRLKGDPMLTAVPVIVVSSEVEAQRDAMALGAAGCLPKPLDVEELLATLGRL